MSVIDRLGFEAARAGDRLGVDFLRYNPVVFRSYDRYALADAPHIIAALRSQFPDAQRVIDVGAGSGAFAAEGCRQGLDVTAIQRSRHGRRRATRHGISALRFDLTATPPARVFGQFDLAYCFEVAEHLPEAMADRLVAFLCAIAPIVVFSAAAPGQGGTGHINEQPAQYWIDRFARHKYLAGQFHLAAGGLSAHWGKTNLLAFGAVPLTGKI